MNQSNYAHRYTANNKKKHQIIYHNDSIGMGYNRPLSAKKPFSIMVWNIFKQQRLDWLPFLKEHSIGRDLILLQEAQATTNLINFAVENYLVADQVPAIQMQNLNSGVMTLSSVYPIYCRPFRMKEPLLRLPKSALITVYPISNGQLLMIINVHAVNFSIGLEIYQEQIKSIVDHMLIHNGPVIFAGDFNTWSRSRLDLLYKFTQRAGLKEVSFPNDKRKCVFKLPLDFIFYRGLYVEDSKIIETNTSDHNPMLVTFKY